MQIMLMTCVTRCSVTAIVILFVNKTLVKWISKCQQTVETSTYGSELVALRITTDLAIKYRYTLHMLGVDRDGPAMMFGDNKSVIINSTMPSSQLKTQHNTVAYHHVIVEGIAAQIINFFHNIPTTFYKLVKPFLFRTSQWS
jgi:hypothetical protein